MLWTDLETTGTKEELDCIIEIGAILTDFEFNPIGDEFTIVVDPDEFALGRMMKTPAVLNMHMKNGLLQDILDGAGTSIENAQKEMLRWMDNTINSKTRKGPVNKFKFMLAGSGVGHFDKRFIKEELPQVNKLLTFPILDVGMVRRFLRFSGVEPSQQPNDQKNHRALDDIRLHLEEARMYRELFRQYLPMGSAA